MEDRNIYCIWVGPSGYIPGFGHKTYGEKIQLTQIDFDKLNEEGFVKTLQAKSSKKKG